MTLSGNGLLPGLAKQVVVLYQQYQKADRFFGDLGELEEVIICTEMLAADRGGGAGGSCSASCRGQ